MTKRARAPEIARAMTAILLVTAGAGCAARPRLSVPAGAASVSAGGRAGVETTTANITVTAKPEAWAGVPKKLDEVTPLLLTLENGRDEPIRVRYEEFALATPDGRTFRALPPFDINAKKVEPVRYAYPMLGYRIAPHHARYFPGYAQYRGLFAWDRAYYWSTFRVFQEYDLPTSDMLIKALPEGVLEPQGKVSGFLYFENIDRDVERVDLVAPIVSAKTTERVGTIRLQFRVN